MRMRKKKHGAERIEACAELLIKEPTAASDPRNAGVYFKDARPVRLEIGCGKGNFAVGMAVAHPDVNFIAVERVADVCCLALEKAMAAKEQRPNDNLRFVIGNAEHLGEWFPPHSIEGIYLNFSDPWPKKGYAKRRLTHRNFLKAYREMLIEGGYLYLKTDNEGLFDFSLEEFEAEGLTVEFVTRDLHSSEKADGNVMTEYEKNFSSQGMPIYSAWVRF
ncbi:MAG: tRNA (guanosine(46)-N7)-methyltransferase TrmB [Clostridia bacterium]|nr:tRNA (guanosine(46)-N7)-methyltransferase TrmB [Clostridia bacterium]